MSTEVPWFKIYASEWLADPALRRCSLPARGMFIDMLALMWNCEQPGVFCTGGMPWTDGDVIRAVGARKSVAKRALLELLANRIVRRDERGAITCDRMVEAEKKRRFCVEAGKRGGNPTLNPGLIPPVKAEPETRNQKKTKNQEPERSVAGSLSEEITDLLLRAGVARRNAVLLATDPNITKELVERTILSVRRQPGVADVGAVIVTALRKELGADLWA